jgi:hypothetical protein
MTYPEDNPLTPKSALSLATAAGEHLIKLRENTRKRKEGPNDQRLTEYQANQKRTAVTEFLYTIRPALAFIAIEWASDDGLRDQISGDTDPITFFEAGAEFDLNVYADMLSLTARATQRYTQGKFEDINLRSTPRTSASDVALQYKVARATPRNDDF